MKFSIAAGLALAGAAFAAPAAEAADAAPHLVERTFFGCQNSFTARESPTMYLPDQTRSV